MKNVYLKIINLHSLELNRCPITNLEYGPKALVFSDAINNNLYQINYHFNKIRLKDYNFYYFRCYIKK